MTSARTILLIALLTAIVGPSAAALVEEVHCSYISYQTIPYGTPKSHVIPLFDPSKGVLVDVDVNFTVNGSQYVGYENTQSFNFTINTSAFYTMGLTLPCGTPLESRIRNNRTHFVEPNPSANPPYFQPPDGFNFTAANYSVRWCNYTDCANLTEFTAATPGETKSFPISASAGATFVPDYQSNRIIQVRTNADTWMCVKYTYDDSKLNITKTGNTSGPARLGEVIEYEIMEDFEKPN